MPGKKTIFATLLTVFAVYSAMVYTAEPNVTPQSGLSPAAASGQHLYQEHNCVACHQLYGLGGYMGPDLTNVISNRGPAYARVFVSAGSRRMPDFDLSDAEVESLIEFLKFVDGSGRYPAQQYEILWTGAYVEADF